MNFVGFALHGFKALMVFAEDVLVRVGIVCALITLLSVVATAAAVVLKVIGFSTPGWFSVALGILLLLFYKRARCANDFNADGSCARGHDYNGHCLSRLCRTSDRNESDQLKCKLAELKYDAPGEFNPLTLAS